jgi:hypothetical protein
MSYKVYQTVKTDDSCADYTVYVNGTKAELNTARVSAYPFNRRWPGHQRQIEQTELVNFLSMESDEEVELRIVPRIPSYAVRIRPRDFHAKAKIHADGSITVRVNGAQQFTVEPYGRSHALHVFIDPVADYRIDPCDPSVRYFGAGEHDVGELCLNSGETLYLDEGAVVYATVFALHAENVRILGRGILDNRKSTEVIRYETNATGNREAVQNASREHAVNILCCQNVTVDGITIRDSLLYNVDCMSSKNVHLNNIKIIGCWRFNSDGVHFSNCTDCSLTNSFLRTFDDSICVRGFANYEYDRFLSNEKEEELSFVCRGIRIANCVIWNDWGKNLQVGTETYAKEITDVTFEHCKLIHTTGNALTIWLVDNAMIHGILFRSILVEYDDCMLKGQIQGSDGDTYTADYDSDYAGWLVSFRTSWHHEYSLIKSAEQLGSIDGVRIRDLQLFSTQRPRFSFRGFTEKSLVQNVELSGVFWNGEAIGTDFFEKQTERNEFVGTVTLKNVVAPLKHD